MFCSWNTYDRRPLYTSSGRPASARERPTPPARSTSPLTASPAPPAVLGPQDEGGLMTRSSHWEDSILATTQEICRRWGSDGGLDDWVNGVEGDQGDKKTPGAGVGDCSGASTSSSGSGGGRQRPSTALSKFNAGRTSKDSSSRQKQHQ